MAVTIRAFRGSSFTRALPDISGSATRFGSKPFALALRRRHATQDCACGLNELIVVQTEAPSRSCGFRAFLSPVRKT